MLLFRHLSLRLLVVALLFVAQSAFAYGSSDKTGDAVMRALADQTASQLARNEVDAVYTSMSPKLKSAYARDELVNPMFDMQSIFGHIKSYDFEAINYGKRSVGNGWIRIVKYWYHAETDKYPDKTYLTVEVTQELGEYYVAGYSMERALLGGKLPFLKN